MKFIYINSSVILAELFYAKVLKAIFLLPSRSHFAEPDMIFICLSLVGC